MSWMLTLFHRYILFSVLKREAYLELYQLWTLSGLTSFHFKVQHPAPNENVAYIDKLIDLIVDQCPDLEKLSLDFKISDSLNVLTSLDEVWERADWKHLHSLYLGGYMTFMDVQGGDLFRQFMVRHAGLQCLEYYARYAYLLHRLCQLNVLQNLRVANLWSMFERGGSSMPCLSSSMAHFFVYRICMLEKLEYLRFQYPGPFLPKWQFSCLRVLILSVDVEDYYDSVFVDLPETLERLCIWAVHFRWRKWVSSIRCSILLCYCNTVFM
jgi:hypothetical protein